jgi:hypothetical protein
MEQHYPEFGRVKLRNAGSLSSSQVYAWTPSEGRTCWIIFYTAKDDLLLLELAWTTTGSELYGLDFIAWHKVLEELPPSGAARVTARSIVGENFQEKINFEVPPPSEKVQEQCIRNIQHSEQFKKVTALKLAKKLKKDPGIDPEAAASAALEENIAGNRLFARLWSHCDKWVELSPAEIEEIVGPEMDRALRVLDTFGVPFLKRRLA